MSVKFDDENKVVTLGEKLSFHKQIHELTGSDDVVMNFRINNERYCMIIPPAIFGQFIEYLKELKR